MNIPMRGDFFLITSKRGYLRAYQRS